MEHLSLADIKLAIALKKSKVCVRRASQVTNVLPQEQITSNSALLVSTHLLRHLSALNAKPATSAYLTEQLMRDT